MSVETSQKTNLSFAWSGALFALACELWNPRFQKIGAFPHYSELLLVVLVLGTLVAINELKARKNAVRGLCAVLGLLCSCLTIALIV